MRDTVVLLQFCTNVTFVSFSFQLKSIYYYIYTTFQIILFKFLGCLIQILILTYVVRNESFSPPTPKSSFGFLCFKYAINDNRTGK